MVDLSILLKYDNTNFTKNCAFKIYRSFAQLKWEIENYTKSGILPAALEPVPTEFRQPVEGQVQDPETQVLVIEGYSDWQESSLQG